MREECREQEPRETGIIRKWFIIFASEGQGWVWVWQVSNPATRSDGRAHSAAVSKASVSDEQLWQSLTSLGFAIPALCIGFAVV